MQVKQSGSNTRTTAEPEDTTELFTRYSTAVYRYCLRRLRSPEEAEDALQITYLNAWRSLKRGCKPMNPRPWLFQIAANVCASVLRTKLGPTRLELHDPMALDELPAVDDPTRDELLGLSSALRELPSRQRRAVLLRDWRGLTYDEIAAELAISDAAVETLLFRARKKLASALALAPAARAVLLWPSTFLRTKSALLTGAEHLKMALVLAGGTVAPFVAFGLLQLFLDSAEGTNADRRAAVVREAAPTPPPSWLEDGRHPHPSRIQPAENRGRVLGHGRPEHGRDRIHFAKRRGATSEAEATAGAAASHGAAASQAAKVVLCHGTHSDTRPGVTIEVSTHALGGHSGDPHGACG